MKNKQHPQNINVCLKCGAVGTHQTTECKEDIPSIEELQEQIQNRIDYALSHVPRGWEIDQFGYYQSSSKNPIKIPENQPNCANCGTFGHTTDKCKRPNRDEIYLKFGESLHQTGHAANEEREDIVNWIQSEYYSET